MRKCWAFWGFLPTIGLARRLDDCVVISMLQRREISHAAQFTPRKVRAPQETVAGNARPAQAERQCHRDKPPAFAAPLLRRGKPGWACYAIARKGDGE